MGTELLTAVTVEQAVVVVFDVNGGAKLAQSLSNKGFGRISLAHHPKHTPRVARDASVHVALVILARGDDEEAKLVRVLGEGPEPPRLIVIAEFETVWRELERRLGEGRKPDRVLVKPVPTAKLVHEIEQQLRQRSVEGRPADDAPLFAEVLAQVWQEQRTGVLRVMSGGMQTVIYLRDGKPLFAEGGTPADMLGRILVETGRITDAQLSEAVELMTNRLVDNEQLQLGGALVELGFLNASELFETLAEQVRRKLLTCFSWRKVRVEYREGAELLAGITEFDNAVPGLLLEGVGQTPPEEVQRFLERVRTNFPVAGAPVREIEQSFRLGGKERRLLDLADGERSVREILADAPTEPVRTGQLLMALILGRALRLKSRPGPVDDQPKSVKGQGSSSMFGSARLVPGEDLEDEQEEEGWNRVKSLFKGAIKRGD